MHSKLIKLDTSVAMRKKNPSHAEVRNLILRSAVSHLNDRTILVRE